MLYLLLLLSNVLPLYLCTGGEAGVSGSEETTTGSGEGVHLESATGSGQTRQEFCPTTVQCAEEAVGESGHKPLFVVFHTAQATNEAEGNKDLASETLSLSKEVNISLSSCTYDVACFNLQPLSFRTFLVNWYG